MTRLVFDGVIVGSFYSLVAVGLVLVYRVSQVFNFAYPAMMFLAALIFSSLHEDESWGSALTAIGVAVLACSVVSVGCYYGAMSFMRGRPSFTQIIATFGISIVIIDVSQIWFGTSPRYPSLPVPKDQIDLPFGIRTNPLDLTLFAVAVVIGAGVIWLSNTTRLGMKMRAIAEDGSLASFVGIRVPLILALTWALAGGLAAIAGVAFGVRANVDPTMVGIGLAAFPAAMMGGMDSPGGAMIGGILLGMVQGVGTTLFGSNAATPIGFIAMLVVMLIWPNGLFGLRPVERV